MPSDQDITLDIATPRGVFHGTFPKTTKVIEVITAVVGNKGLNQGEQFDLTRQGEPLQPTDRPLVSFGLTDGTQLELVATGSGV